MAKALKSVVQTLEPRIRELGIRETARTAEVHHSDILKWFKNGRSMSLAQAERLAAAVGLRIAAIPLSKSKPR